MDANNTGMAENINREEFTRWLSPYWLEIQEKLFPMIAQAGQEKPTQQIERLVQILEIVRVEESVSSPERAGKGRPCVDRRPLARAFVAKWRNGGAIYACGSQSARNQNFRANCKSLKHASPDRLAITLPSVHDVFADYLGSFLDDFGRFDSNPF